MMIRKEEGKVEESNGKMARQIEIKESEEYGE